MTTLASDTVIMITRNGMGDGNPELQSRLIEKYLALLIDGGVNPAAICLYTDGVKLAVSGSPVLKQLKALEENGVRLILCSTCLDFCLLTDKVQVGIVGGMGDIIEAQLKAEKVISI